jgi:hypothetical protein
MSARTFAEWQAYCSLEPFGPPAEFWRAGLLASILANVHRKKNQAPFKPEDFMPKGLQQDPLEMDATRKAEILRQNFETYQQAHKGIPH